RLHLEAGERRAERKDERQVRGDERRDGVVPGTEVLDALDAFEAGEPRHREAGQGRARRRAGARHGAQARGGSRLASSSRVLMLRNASASSSNGTSATASDAYHLSILRCPEPRNARSEGRTSRRMRQNTGWGWSPVRATAR